MSIPGVPGGSASFGLTPVVLLESQKAHLQKLDPKGVFVASPTGPIAVGDKGVITTPQINPSKTLALTLVPPERVSKMVAGMMAFNLFRV